MLFFLNTYIPTILYKIFNIYIMPEHDDSDTESETDDERRAAREASVTDVPESSSDEEENTDSPNSTPINSPNIPIKLFPFFQLLAP